KVTEDAFKDDLRSCPHRVEDAGQVFDICPQAVHPGIDLEMKLGTTSGLGRNGVRGALQQFNVAALPDRRREPLPDDLFFLAAPESTQDQDALLNSNLAQRNPFCNRADGQPLGARVTQCQRACGDAVSVSIAFDDWAYAHLRTYMGLNGVQVMSQRCR